jgi:hypothetical protein
MTTRPPPQIDDESGVSVSVRMAALSLGCDPSTVRALLRIGQLSGHKVGKGARPGGVRVHEASIHAYKRRHAIGGRNPGDEQPPERQERPQGQNPAHREAMARLRQLGAL